jgi:hypothetical protein
MGRLSSSGRCHLKRQHLYIAATVFLDRVNSDRFRRSEHGYRPKWGRSLPLVWATWIRHYHQGRRATVRWTFTTDRGRMGRAGIDGVKAHTREDSPNLVTRSITTVFYLACHSAFA